MFPQSVGLTVWLQGEVSRKIRNQESHWHLGHNTGAYLSCWPLSSRCLLLETLDSNLAHDLLYSLFFSVYLSVSKLAGQLSWPDTTLQKARLFCQALVSGHLTGCCLAQSGQLLNQVPILGPDSFVQGSTAMGPKTWPLIHRNHIFL